MSTPKEKLHFITGPTSRTLFHHVVCNVTCGYNSKHKKD